MITPPTETRKETYHVFFVVTEARVYADDYADTPAAHEKPLEQLRDLGVSERHRLVRPVDLVLAQGFQAVSQNHQRLVDVVCGEKT